MFSNSDGKIDTSISTGIFSILKKGENKFLTWKMSTGSFSWIESRNKNLLLSKLGSRIMQFKNIEYFLKFYFVQQENILQSKVYKAKYFLDKQQLNIQSTDFYKSNIKLHDISFFFLFFF